MYHSLGTLHEKATSVSCNLTCLLTVLNAAVNMQIQL